MGVDVEVASDLLSLCLAQRPTVDEQPTPHCSPLRGPFLRI
tara:strand:+ start:100 stop:222 length:123 start_codon:yes stop_codon:yes gene_type:complete